MPLRLQPVPRKKKPANFTVWPGLKDNELINLTEKVKTHFQWDHTPRAFQLDAIKAQLQRKDVVIHAGTGSGKTAVAAGPHVYDEVKGMVTFMVSPLIALQQEQVETFTNEFGLKAIAINSVNGGCTGEIMRKVCNGDWQIVIISPEMMLSKKFIRNVIRNKELAHRVLSVVIDEAHVVSHWGSGFRKRYGSLGILRALLPKNTPMVAMSATLPARVRHDVLRKLQYSANYLDLNVGNDRPNVSLVVRAIQHPMNTFQDLAFLIPNGVKDPKDIKKTFIYADDVSAGADIEDFLYSQCPAEWRTLGVTILPYSAVFSDEYRATVMALFRLGIVRILICTDAAGMGCNIPDIDIVVQWKLPATLSSFVQRAGRAARGAGRVGLAVLLVEKSVYNCDLRSIEHVKEDYALLSQTKHKKKKKNVREASKYPKGAKGYANAHGVARGAYGGKLDAVHSAKVPIDFDAIDEGLHSFAQTGSCRRAFLTKIYKNNDPAPTVPCCDICDPLLFKKTRPGKYAKPKRKAAVETGQINEMVRDAVEKWRESIWERDFPHCQFGPSGLLNNKAVNTIASIGPIQTVLELERVVDGWVWFGQYGDSLLALLRSLPIPPMIPIPKESKAAKGTKRKAGESGVSAGEKAKGKKARTKAASSVQPATSLADMMGASFHTSSSRAAQSSLLSAHSHFNSFQTYPHPTHPPSYPYPHYPHQYQPVPLSHPQHSVESSPSVMSNAPFWEPYPPQTPHPSHSGLYQQHEHRHLFMSTPSPFPQQHTYSTPSTGYPPQGTQQNNFSVEFHHYNPLSDSSGHG